MNNAGVVYRLDDPWSVNTDLDKIGRVPSREAEPPMAFLPEREARRIVDVDPSAAGRHAREALKSDPRDPQALFLLGAALRKEGKLEEALATLQPLVESQPHLGHAWHQLGLVLARLGRRDPAIDALLRAIDLDWLNRDAWFVLGSLLTFPQGADVHERRAEPSLAQAKTALRDGRPDIAERIVRDLLRNEPGDVQAIKFLADMLYPLRRWAEFEQLLKRCLELAPDFTAARFRYATALFAHGNYRLALPHIDELLKSDPGNRLYRALKALALNWDWQFEPAIAEFESFIHHCKNQPGFWYEYARLLRIAGKPSALAAYKTAFEILPSFVGAYLSLAYSKTIAMDDSIVERVRAQLAHGDLGAENRAQLHFVLGEALEDLGRYAESFESYRASNEILCGARHVSIEQSNGYLRRAKAMFTKSFFHARQGVGCPETGPIFIVGMPRSGSTLVEQILSAHSQVEGLGELDCLPQAVARVAPETPDDPEGMYPYVFLNMDPARFRRIGEEYMAAAKRRRRPGRPFFTDKMPHNYTLTGLIHLALPNARIVDVRRHPLDCCWSCFKHYFPAGQPLTLGLRDIGREYANCAELMAHFDEVLPGKVHRVIYERLIENFEEEVRLLLQYLGLPFEPACLRFHEHERYAGTISTEQVRMPLYSSGMGQWRRYEPWLGPLKEELGYVLDVYPRSPGYYPEVNGRSVRPLRWGPAGAGFQMVKGVRQIAFEPAFESRASAQS